MADIAESGAPPSTATVVTDAADGRRFVVAGQLDATTLPKIWEWRAALSPRCRKPIVIDAAGVDYCDGAGLRHRSASSSARRQDRRGEPSARFQTLLNDLIRGYSSTISIRCRRAVPRSRKSRETAKSGATSAAR
jgi:hypothetical protein